jgi:HD-like signal output (HDOD) protein/prolyl-tRNA editing enzyme YbaK/EbsC (Cys-tRNA(Pro) deacylase)
MAIPVVVDQILRKQNIDYQVLDLAPGAAAPLQAGGTALSSLLCDGNSGRLQVIHAADSLLDLNALNQLTGRDWRAVAPAEMARLCAQHHLRQLPAVPAALGVPSIVDARLLERPALAVSSGDEQQLVQLSAEQFRRALASATIADIAVPVAGLQQPALAEVDDVVDITRAVASFTQLRMRQRIEETLELPPLPETAQRILKLRVDPYADIRDLTNIVELDPALAAQVISWAGSPYYAAPGKIQSVHDAIVRVLGFDLVMNLALGLALGRTLRLPKDAPRGFTPYWKQAIYVATAVEALVGCIPSRQRPTIGLAYLAGLLHNFGFLMLAEIFPPHFASYCRYQEANPHLNYNLIERFLLGVDRDQLAAWLMKLWGLPEEVVGALRHQADAGYDGPQHRYANLVHVAVRLLRLHGIGGMPPEPVPEALYARLHLDPADALAAIQQVVEASAEIDGIAASLAA